MVKSKELKIMRKKVDKADKLPNPLALVQTIPPDLPFAFPKDKKGDNKDDGDNNHSSASDESTMRLQALSSSETSQEMLQSCLQLFEDNMGELYRVSTWGLNLQEKADEFRHRKARFLLVWAMGEGDEGAKESLAAFCHYRFCFDDEERPDWAVLYVYELQVAKGFQRKNIGLGLQHVLEEVGRQAQMAKIMLTVFHNNPNAQRFYRDKCGYKVDETDPSNYKERADYIILSKNL